MGRDHFELINWRAVERARVTTKEENCGEYKDAPVCKDGERDVQNPVCASTLDRYRGCNTSETDCANCATASDNQDDRCCVGSNEAVGDNIDHYYCAYRDAGWGGISLCWWWVRDSNEPPAY